MRIRLPRHRRIIAGTLAAASLGGLAGVPATGAARLARSIPAETSTPSKPVVSATLQECLTTGSQDERSATFAGEMNVVAGTSKMEMRIDVLERLPGEANYHAVSAPGLGVWRSSAPGVKVYKYLKQVTNLSAPAFYRAAVRFRWLNAKGRLIFATELHTPRCEQPAPVTPTTPSTPSPPSTGMPLE
jgi:hypothetical protein